VIAAGRGQVLLQVMDAAAVRRWAATCVQSLDAHKDAINRINVYPVPDGDTGSNLLATMRAGLDALLRAPAEQRSGAGPAFAVLAKGALAGARGNSGVLLSQVLRGLAEAVREQSEVDGAGLALALDRGSELASAALSDPVEGTMLTVLHAAASAAAGCHTDDLHEVATAAALAAASALSRTPRQLAVLADAGVVDAGGRGVVVVLEALTSVVADEPLGLSVAVVAPPERLPESLVTARESGSEKYSYEVMYLLDGTAEPQVRRLRNVLTGLGDCVSVAGDGDGLWTVHVHCNDIGAAVEVGVESGRPHRITVARFADEPVAESPRFGADRAVVVAGRGEGLAELVRGEGAAVFVVAEDSDPYQLLDVITATAAAQVTVMPSGVDLTELADEAAIRAVAGGQDVVVVPCSSPVQVLAALAVHDVRRKAGDDVVAMAEAAAATRRGEVAVATEDAMSWVGRVASGDVLGFMDGEVVMIEPGPASAETLGRVACTVVDRMLAAGGELVTVLVGSGGVDGLAEELEDFLHTERPEADLVVYQGGQTDSVLAIGVE
jgi:DAK2 domain fusion protein YloV